MCACAALFDECIGTNRTSDMEFSSIDLDFDTPHIMYQS